MTDLTTSTLPPNPIETPSELERLRDILFGHQSRSIEQRFQALEVQVTQLFQELNSQMQSQDTAVRAEIADRTTRLQQALTEAMKASHQRDDALEAALHQLSSHLEASKVSRQALGTLFIEVGKQLQNNASS